MKTFNRRIQEGINNGTIKSREIEGVTVYFVEPPREGEEVVGYESSDCFSKDTPTERASHEAERDSD